MLRSEDWLSVWLGTVIIALVVVGIRPDEEALSCRDGVAGLFASGRLATTVAVGLALLVLYLAGVRLMDGSGRGFARSFPALFALAWAAQVVACGSALADRGLNYAVTSLALGLLVSNALKVPAWLRGAMRTGFYIKSGLVILGSSVLFDRVVEAGAYGMVQAVAVIVVIWFACYWIARRLRVDDESSALLATAVSIGVSAAIAACGAIAGDRKKLSYVLSLVLVVAAPMMIVMPLAVDLLGVSAIVGGAWIGGTIDTIGAVVVAGESIGESATNAATIVKLSQNALLGVAAFALSVWWTMPGSGAGDESTATASVIWERFPKFVLGFLAASMVFSFALSDELVDATSGVLQGVRTWLFSLAFVCIGLETRLRDLVSLQGGRPAVAFLLAQAVNVLWTLLLAWVLFGGVIFAVPDL